MLVSAVQQCESATCTHTSPPSWASLPPSVPPLWGITEHQAELPALHGRFPLAVYFTHGSVNMSVLPSVLLSLKENVTDAQMVALRWAVWGPWGRRPARRCPHLTAGVGSECNPNPHPLHHALCFSKSSLLFLRCAALWEWDMVFLLWQRMEQRLSEIWWLIQPHSASVGSWGLLLIRRLCDVWNDEPSPWSCCFVATLPPFSSEFMIQTSYFVMKNIHFTVAQPFCPELNLMTGVVF